MSTGQSKTGSLVESLANIAAGMGISFALTEYLLHAPLITNAALTAILTLASIVRQFVIRRLFNKLTERRERFEKLVSDVAVSMPDEYPSGMARALAREIWNNATRDGRCRDTSHGPPWPTF